MSRRAVPLAPEVVTDLKEWRIALGPEGEPDLMFPNASGRVEQHKSMLESTAPVLVAAGVVAKDKDGKPVVDNDGKPRPRYALHACRHFFASWCINPMSRGGRGLSAKEVQALLGHETIGITMDIYGHLFPRGDDHAELAASTARLFG
jgi:integrase